MSKWILDSVALHHAARKVLGIQEPVTVRLIKKHDPYKWSAGYYDAFPLHVCWVNPDLSKHDDKNPSHTIWHELAHALQCERDFGGDGVAMEMHNDQAYAYVIDDDHQPTALDDEWYEIYWRIPQEAEAEQIANRYYRKFPLVKIRS